jgi:hypothetical protein
MNIRLAMVSLAALAALSTSALAAKVQYGDGVYSPEKGVICDGQAKWCADGTGLSASWTEQYFGADMASKLDGVDQSTFAYTNRVQCSISTQSCTGGGPAAEMQAMLFGTAAAASGGSGGGSKIDFGSGVYSPEKGVICDTRGQWCADGTGLSASWTQQYFGDTAAGKLAGVTQDVFGFSNRVKCATATQSCTGSSSKIAKKMSKALFGH